MWLSEHAGTTGDASPAVSCLIILFIFNPNGKHRPWVGSQSIENQLVLWRRVFGTSTLHGREIGEKLAMSLGNSMECNPGGNNPRPSDMWMHLTYLRGRKAVVFAYPERAPFVITPVWLSLSEGPPRIKIPPTWHDKDTLDYLGKI